MPLWMLCFLCEFEYFELSSKYCHSKWVWPKVHCNLNSFPHNAAYMRRWTGWALVQRQAITQTNPDFSLIIGHLGRNLSETRIKIWRFSFKKMHLKISSAKWRPFCPGEDELKEQPLAQHISLGGALFSANCWLMGWFLSTNSHAINSSLRGQNVRHFADDIFSFIFVTEKFCILIKISLKFVPRGPIEKQKQTKKLSIGLDNGLAKYIQATSHYLNQCDPIHWRIYAASGGDELMDCHLWPLLLTWFNFNPGMDK